MMQKITINTHKNTINLHKCTKKNFHLFTKNLHKYTQNFHKFTENFHKTCTKRRKTTTAHLAGDGRLKGQITITSQTMETSRHRSLKGKCEYLSPELYKGNQTWLIYLQSADVHCWFLQNESSQELKVWAEEPTAEDKLDDGFLN